MTVEQVLIERANDWVIDLSIRWPISSLPLLLMQVLADSVEDHDGVVGREADDREHRGEEQRADLPALEVAHDGGEAEDHEDVVQQGDDGATCRSAGPRRSRPRRVPKRKARYSTIRTDEAITP